VPGTDGERASDADLLRRHVAGDSDAFGELFRRHRDRLWAVALRTVCDPEEAADALQDAMISAFRRAADFRGDSAVTTWLHRIVVNACLDRLRRRAVRPVTSAGDEQALDALAAHDPDPARAADTRDGGHARLLGRRRRRHPGHLAGHDQEPLRPGPRPAPPVCSPLAREPIRHRARLTCAGK
jgi:RNA polymerase sigma factor (sigma-70 family)